MSNEYSPGFPIDTGPGPDGDTNKAGFDKAVQEINKIYADMTALYQKLLLELQYADVDMVDGKHADGSANNIPLLNGSSELTNNVSNSSVETETLEVSGTATIDTLQATSFTLNGQSLAANITWGTKGSISLPIFGGLILQWDRVVVNSRSKATFDLHQPFPTEGIIALVTPYTDSYTDTSSSFFSGYFPSSSQITITVGNFSGRPVNYLALGR